MNNKELNEAIVDILDLAWAPLDKSYVLPNRRLVKRYDWNPCEDLEQNKVCWDWLVEKLDAAKHRLHITYLPIIKEWLIEWADYKVSSNTLEVAVCKAVVKENSSA